jgi:uncharacterized protein YndB with AHSA1/START domain
MTMQATETGPIQKTVLVPLPVEKAFQLFTDGIDSWWPFETHSWDPPTRFAVDWHVSQNVIGSQVEVRFVPEGDETRVELEHRRWEQCAPGARENYDRGWEHVLSKLVAAA